MEEKIKALKEHGVITKILTGDNDKVTRTICKQVGLKVRNMLLGPWQERQHRRPDEGSWKCSEGGAPERRKDDQ